jgi:hypothetical protein
MRTAAAGAGSFAWRPRPSRTLAPAGQLLAALSTPSHATSLASDGSTCIAASGRASESFRRRGRRRPPRETERAPRRRSEPGGDAAPRATWPENRTRIRVASWGSSAAWPGRRVWKRPRPSSTGSRRRSGSISNASSSGPVGCSGSPTSSSGQRGTRSAAERVLARAAERFRDLPHCRRGMAHRRRTAEEADGITPLGTRARRLRLANAKRLDRPCETEGPPNPSDDYSNDFNRL